jgi:diadenosine tetraphosphatase ApaH/serine/threonine PP2A family protein phosphatase
LGREMERRMRRTRLCRGGPGSSGGLDLLEGQSVDELRFKMEVISVDLTHFEDLRRDKTETGEDCRHRIWLCCLRMPFLLEVKLFIATADL